MHWADLYFGKAQKTQQINKFMPGFTVLESDHFSPWKNRFDRWQKAWFRWWLIIDLKTWLKTLECKIHILVKKNKNKPKHTHTHHNIWMLPTAPSKPQLCAVFMNSKVNNRLEPAGALKYVQMLYKLVMDYEKKKTKQKGRSH